MRKKFLLPCCVLLITLLISGCSKQSENNGSKATQPTTNKQIETAAQTKPEIKTEPETTASANKSYNDGTISCEYDSSTLKVTALKPTDTFPYLVIIGKLSDKTADSFNHGDCICCCTMKSDGADYLFDNFPTLFTQYIFKEVLDITDSESLDAKITENKDGTYSHNLNTNEFNINAKILNVSNDYVTYMFCRTSNSLSDNIAAAFSDCYNSLDFLKKPEEKETKPEAETEPETTQSANKSYNDGTISCEYDSSILKITTFEPSDEVPYFVIIGKTSDNPKETLDGDCIQINTMPFKDCEMLFENYPAAFTQTLFNNIFGVPESAMPTLTRNQKDGTYEYDLETQDFTYKAKVVKAVDDLVTFAFYKTANDLQAEIKSNFNDCYNSLTFLDQKENETEANKPSKITSGDLYDSITAIYPDVTLHDMRDGTLSISIYMSGGSVDSNSVAFFYLTNEILNNCNIEKEYSSVSVDMMADDKLTAMLTLLSYKSATSYKSDFIVLQDSYKEAMEKVYNEGFLAHDIGAVFDSELESLADKYGIKY